VFGGLHLYGNCVCYNDSRTSDLCFDCGHYDSWRLTGLLICLVYEGTKPTMIPTCSTADVLGWMFFGGFFGVLIGICTGIIYMEWVAVVNPNYRRVINFKRKPWHHHFDERELSTWSITRTEKELPKPVNENED
jgi:hypothetical protein